MAQKQIEIAGIGTVTLVKTAQNRNLRLSVTASGVRVSLPRWTTFAAAASFAATNHAWIQHELSRQQDTLLQQGQRIGTQRHLHFMHSLQQPSVKTRVTIDTVLVYMLLHESATSPAVQQRARHAATRALRLEAEGVLPGRLRLLSDQHGLPFKSVSIKQLKRRWGSCNSHNDIALNLFLVELPDAYIDYVLLHELAHTKHMNHGVNFWNLLEQLEPGAQLLAKRLRRHQPAVGNWDPDVGAGNRPQ